MNAAGPTPLERSLPAALLRWEGALVCVVAWGLLLLIPLSNAALGLSWDALNHHIYLGWTAQQHRFDRDFLGAGYQSFQAPYVNWPLYRMALDGWSGRAAGVMLASLQATAVWPVWMLARACVPGPSVYDFTMRALAVMLAFLSGLVLSAFGASINDLLAAVPMVWALALAMEPIARGATLSPVSARRYVLLSGVSAGLAVALKLSNGPFAILLPLLWLQCASHWRGRIQGAALGGLAAIGAFLLAYGHWGSLLWQYYGNPVYPFDHPWFSLLRTWVWWAR
ncbi:hypothetical protein WG902_05680 [Ramlibacter sp. PS3R-8]|uniref:hypothetical protein n=1 Tax=Ramlibacter sp. PS3R-8 TaxID=3133437 RepID=UPI0030A26F4C